MQPEYTLMFGEIKIGKVVKTSEDFPSLSGDFLILLDFERSASPVATRIKELFALSKKQGDLTENGEDHGEVWEALVAEEERFVDLIESKQWRLLLPDGKQEPILAPMLFSDGGIVWRWALD